MKMNFIFIVGVIIILGSCNNIPNNPVFEKLDTDDLSRAIKSDTLFYEFYENVRKEVDEMDDIKKAEFNNITYRRLFKYFKFLKDTTYWKPLTEKWDEEWDRDFSLYSVKADSALNYWKKYLDENSLNKYAKIELVTVKKDYYEYIGELNEVHLGFRMTPLQGSIQQLRFSYGYKAKIHGENNYYEKHTCIETDPLYSPRIGYWKVDYSDKDKFAGKNVDTFLRDYNMYIEITEIRKDGVNISVDDFSIPKEISKCLEVEKDYPSLVELYKVDLIKSLINRNYLEKWEYINKKANELQEKEDKFCFDFMKQI